MTPSAPGSRPQVSIVLPTLDERGFIRDCLDSLLAQDYTDITEILVVDGGSADGTREIVSAMGAPVRLLDNPRVAAAAALNIGMREAKGEVVVRGDAHAWYEPDYVRRCVEVLGETGADNVGGCMRPVGVGTLGCAIAAATSSPLGMGPGRFHYAKRREEVDTVWLGCWRRETLERLGGFDEENLQWGAEDHELNMRLRQGGGRIILDPSICAWYFPRNTWRGLWRQYFNYGVGKASTLVKHRSIPSRRPLAPAALVAGSALMLLAGRGLWRLGPPAAHAGFCALAAWKMSGEPGARLPETFAVMESCHWSYGLGFWTGLWRAIRGRVFDARPRGHR